MRYKISLLALVVCLWSAIGFSEFYRYRDENGVLRFTENIADIPKNQRKGIYITPEDRLSAEELAAQKAGVKTQEKAVENPELAHIDQARELKERQIAVNKEHAAITAEQKRLAREKTKLSTVAHNKLVEQLNQRIKEYQSKRDQLNQVIRKFNLKEEKK